MAERDPMLPSNASPLESALTRAIAPRVVPEALRALWDVARCPVRLLPWLAWALSVDEWDETWSETIKRRVIAEAITLHRQKGTVAAVRRAIAALGFGDAEIIEGTAAGWAVFEVHYDRQLTAPQGAMALRAIAAAAPARCHLATVDYTGAALTYNGVAHFDGTYSFGAYGV